jgi:glycosyltransferase involved in cell wall biosynthesis
MKKICFVVSSPTTASIFLSDHLKNLSKFYEVDIVANFGPNYQKQIDKLNVPIYRKINLFKDLQALFRLIQLFKRNKYVSVHSVTPKAGLLSMIAAFIVQVPNRIHWFTGQVWKTKKGFRRTVFKYFDKVIYLLSTNNLVDSESQYQFLLENRIIGKKSQVIANGSICGVNDKKFYPDVQKKINIRRKLNIDEKEIVILFLGRMVKDKGIRDLLESLSQIRVNSNICLLLVGEDEEGILNSTINKSLHSELRIIHIPFINDPENYIRASDIFCMPSYREGFGLSVIEAAASSVPTVAYDIYGVSDAVVTGETGILVPLGNIKGLTSALLFLINNPEERKEMGQKARLRVLEKFPTDLVVNGLENFYLQNIGYASIQGRSKILHISASILTINNFVKPFKQALVDRGIDSIFGVGINQEPDNHDYISLPIERGPNFFRAWPKYRKIKKLVLKSNPTWIIFHTPLSVFACSLMLKNLKNKGIKLIYLARGSLDESESLMARLLWFFFDPTVWKIWDSVGVVNNFLLDRCMQRNIPVKLLSLGGASLNLGQEPQIDTFGYKQQDPLKLGWIGRMDKDKRLFDFFELLKILNEDKFLAVEGQIVGDVVLGDVPGKIPASTYTKYFGWLDDPWKVLGKCDLLISTSIREGYGLAPIEAGYHGIPTIGYRNHGTIKSITESGGILVDKYDLNSLVGQVIKWSVSPTSEKIALKKYTKDKCDELLKKSNQIDELIDLIKLAG